MLGRVRTAAAVDAMLEALRGAGAEEREAAAVALGFAESERGVAPLVAVLARDAEASVRAAAAYALGRIERPEATEALSAALRGDRDARVRRAAAHALGEIHG